jgi:hypothetical protein
VGFSFTLTALDLSWLRKDTASQPEEPDDNAFKMSKHRFGEPPGRLNAKELAREHIMKKSEGQPLFEKIHAEFQTMLGVFPMISSRGEHGT